MPNKSHSTTSETRLSKYVHDQHFSTTCREQARCGLTQIQGGFSLCVLVCVCCGTVPELACSSSSGGTADPLHLMVDMKIKSGLVNHVLTTTHQTLPRFNPTRVTVASGDPSLPPRKPPLDTPGTEFQARLACRAAPHLAPPCN